MSYHKKRLLSCLLKTALIITFSIIVLVPFFFMLGAAFKPGSEINAYPPTIIPKDFTIVNFHTLLETAPFIRFFFNSLTVAVFSAIGVVFTSTISGFVFAKYRFWLNSVLFALVFSTSIIPFEVYMVPLYTQMVGWNLNNTMTCLILPYLVMSFGVFFMRQLIAQQIPDDLLDAARIDGASEFRIFFQILFPLLQSGVAALAILAFVEGWNAFVWPLITVSNNRLFTMELGLALFQTTFNVDLGAVGAGSLCSAAPILIVFFIFRRQIMDSIAMTGMKS